MAESKYKHILVPSDKEDKYVCPKDLLVYCALRRYENWKTNETFVSLSTIRSDLSISIPTIIKSIKNLVLDHYISIRKEGRKNCYIFNPYKRFEGFSDDFLKNPNLTFEEKAYLTAILKFMRTEGNDCGKISYSNEVLADKINCSTRSIYRYDRSLQEKNYLTIVDNKMRDLETGCLTKTKIFNLNDYGQQIVFILRAHHDQIIENTNAIAALKEEVKELRIAQKQWEKEKEAYQRTINSITAPKTDIIL